jgi:hypothetical protein
VAQVKGKFITLSTMLMADKPEYLEKVNAYLQEETGLKHLELDPEDFYDTAIFEKAMQIYGEASGEGEQGYVTIGKRVYPTIKISAGLPDYLETPLDYIQFEFQGFLENHSDDVEPREILKLMDGDVEGFAPAPGYSSKLYEGVFLGILEMCEAKNPKVEMTSPDVFKITWDA